MTEKAIGKQEVIFLVRMLHYKNVEFTWPDQTVFQPWPKLGL